MPPQWLQGSKAEPRSWQARISQLREGSLGEWHCQNVSLQEGVVWNVRLGATHLCDGSLPSDVGIFPWIMCLEREDRTQTCPGLGRLFPVCSLLLFCPVSRAAAGEGLEWFSLYFGIRAPHRRSHLPQGPASCSLEMLQLPACASGAHGCMAEAISEARFHAGRVLHRC